MSTSLGMSISLKRSLKRSAKFCKIPSNLPAYSGPTLNPDYKERILRARAEDALHTTLFDIGWPEATHRVLRNSVVADWEAAGCPPPGQRPHESEVIGQGRFGDMVFPVSRYTAMPPSVRFEGEVEKAALYAGQSCGLISDLLPAAVIVEGIARDAEARLLNLPKDLCA